jgi:uncharacterized damage-inducible protein DinB
MSGSRNIPEETIANALSGKGAHAATMNLFAGLDWKVAGARPKGVPHSIFQLLNHISYWQDWVVKWLDGEDPPLPKHASGSWPGVAGPASAADWQRAVRRFRSGLEGLDHRSREGDLLGKRGTKSRLEMIQTIASHNSYHVGQVVLVRQQLGAWPPPSGGATW